MCRRHSQRLQRMGRCQTSLVWDASLLNMQTQGSEEQPPIFVRDNTPNQRSGSWRRRGGRHGGQTERLQRGRAVLVELQAETQVVKRSRGERLRCGLLLVEAPDSPAATGEIGCDLELPESQLGQQGGCRQRQEMAIQRVATCVGYRPLTQRSDASVGVQT